MFPRGEWLRSLMQHGERARLPFALFYFITFEAYYRLCTLPGYRPRHFLDSMAEGVRARPEAVSASSFTPVRLGRQRHNA